MIHGLALPCASSTALCFLHWQCEGGRITAAVYRLVCGRVRFAASLAEATLRVSTK